MSDDNGPNPIPDDGRAVPPSVAIDDADWTCPNCEAAAVDSAGAFRRSIERHRIDKHHQVRQRWVQRHCPECDTTFAVLAGEEEDRVAPDGGYYEPPNTGRVHDPTPDPEQCCIDCGREAYNFRCPCCGYPLCHRHHETQGGFCSRHLTIGGVPVCAYDQEVYVSASVYQEPTLVLVAVGSRDRHDVYHLPAEVGTTNPLCRPREDAKQERPLRKIKDDRELCTHCARAARQDLAAIKEAVAEELANGGDRDD